MILTLTPNPSVDRTIAIDELLRGQVQRATDTRMDPGGKGINVSRALGVNGGKTLAILPVGGGHGRMMTDLLREAGTPVLCVPIQDAIRANIALVEPDGTTTKINELGPVLFPGEVDALFGAVTTSCTGEVSWVVGCGSLPRGMDDTAYAELIRRLSGSPTRVAIDTSGEPLKHAVAAHPHLIKPNRAELGELVGRDLATLADVVAAARDLIADGIETVLVSLGKDGAVLITATRLAHARARVGAPMSTVGAGDCTLAGYLLATERGEVPSRALAIAVAFGAAAVALPGSEVPSPEQVAAVHVELDEDPDPAMPLTD